MPVQLVYDDGYDLRFGEHVFPTVKYRMVRDALLECGAIRADQIHKPQPASDEDVLLAHSVDWVNRLRRGTVTYEDVRKLEIPYSRSVVDAFWLAAGGTILASRLALTHGVGFNIGGGFHHACPGHGEGFCAINDIAIAVRRLQKDGAIGRAMVIDADVHHGNGTAAIFAGDPSVFTLSIHQFNNYPDVKPPSTLDINLADGATDAEYLRLLRESCRLVIPAFRPDLIVYVAGADPYHGDQLGGLNLTLEGLRARDAAVFETALAHRVPVAVTLAGGYAENLSDTVQIHAGAAVEAERALSKAGWR